ncbi:MAG: outer membrane protein [Xanthobacteraceae bacterium]|jgi:outer membrane immunogenic protein
MIKSFTGATLMALALVAAPARAADVPVSPAPAYVNATPFGAYSWSGAYVGFNLGYQWGSVSNSRFDPSGFNGGLQGGYNWQTGQFVIGGETDLQLSSADDMFAAYKFSNPWFGTTRLRAGIAMNNILLYATAGLAYGTGKVDFGALTETNTQVGWTAGAGVEVGFTQHWSAKAEFLYVDLSDHSYVLTGTTNGLASAVVRLGVNYRF